MTLRNSLRLFILALAVAAATAGGAGAATPAANPVSPLCSLYGVTLTTELLTTEFDSPKLAVNARKWPLLMAQARNARVAFDKSPLLSVRGRYDALVRELGVVGERLGAGRRAAALAELKSAAPDLDAVLAVAQRAHLGCRSGSTTFFIR